MNDKNTEHFWSKVQIGEPHECWDWTASQTPKGYGQLWVGKKLLHTHRLAWEVAVGPIPDDLCVCHHCDNPSCCNPAHLFLGTSAENRADCVAKRRQARGVKQHDAKLTATNVHEIRTLLNDGVPQRTIAHNYHVTQATISNINTGKRWGWLKAEAR